MEHEYITDLQQMTTQQLQEMIQREAAKETPDDELVLQLLHILEKRDAEKPVELGPKSKAAWKKYQARAMARTKKTRIYPTWLVRAASLILIAGFLFAIIPQQATAGSFWKILTSWTDTIFEYVNIGAGNKEPEGYMFETDNPGLQQVYDTVVKELGITDPVVPKWLPEGNALGDIAVVETPGKKSVCAYFLNGEVETVLSFNNMKEDRSPQYDKVEIKVDKYEFNGISHYIIRNNDVWVISWVRNNLKCSIYIDCQETDLEKLIRSIY